jgi:hypothetical protein
VARYKVLSSIAHNFGQTFVGASKARHDDHLLGHLLADARRTGQSTLWVDIVTGEARPDALVSRSLRRVLDRHAQEFPALVAGHQSQMAFVRGARMELSFDLAVERPSASTPGRIESPYLCRVWIEDDRGKTWLAELRGWSEPYESSWDRLTRWAGRG